VVGPLGTFLAEPVWDKEAIVYADLNRDDLVEAKVRMLSRIKVHTIKGYTLLIKCRWILILSAVIRGQIYCKSNHWRHPGEHKLEG